MIINLSKLLLFFYIDIFQLNTLWGENIDRRVFHYLMNANYNPRKEPYLKFYPKLMNINPTFNQSILKIENQYFEFNNLEGNGLNTVNSLLSLLGNGLYSKRSTIYYGDFNKIDQNKLLQIGNKIKRKISKSIQKELYFGNSDFKIVLLRYEGDNAYFPWHYDTEPKECYRTLTLIKKNSTLPSFNYRNINEEVTKINFNLGDTIFFKGTKTYHTVESTNDKYTIRWMLGYQFCEIEYGEHNIEKSLCSEFRGQSILTIIYQFIPLIIPVALILKIMNFMNTWKLNVNSIYYIYLHFFIVYYKIKTTHLNLKTYILYYLYTLVYYEPMLSLSYINYILLTE